MGLQDRFSLAIPKLLCDLSTLHNRVRVRVRYAVRVIRKVAFPYLSLRIHHLKYTSNLSFFTGIDHRDVDFVTFQIQPLLDDLQNLFLGFVVSPNVELSPLPIRVIKKDPAAFL